MAHAKRMILLTIVSLITGICSAQEGSAKDTRLTKQLDELIKKESIAIHDFQSIYFRNQNNEKQDSIDQLYLKAVAPLHAQAIVLVKRNANSLASARSILSYLHLLKRHSASLNTIIMEGTAPIVVETILRHAKECHALFDKKVKESAIGLEVTEYIANVEHQYTASNRIQVGKIAPDFTLPDPEGSPFSLYEIQCKLKIIDFWASWCKPCRMENPDLMTLYNEFQSKGLEIIGISLDNDKAQWLEAIEEDGLLWQYHGSTLKGWKESIAKDYNVHLIPSLFLLDNENRILAINLRGEELKQKVAALLNP